MIATQTSIELSLYQKFAAVFCYPQADYGKQIMELEILLSDEQTNVRSLFAQFRDAVKDLSCSHQQELYTRTFDLMAMCSPYAGVHLFGEDNYKRGALLATLNDENQRRNFFSEKELPDHISVLLRFLSIATEEEKIDTVEFLLKKPVQIMIELLEKNKNPYGFLCRTLEQILHNELQREA